MNLVGNSFKYSRAWLHNMQLKSLVATLRLRAKQPVTATAAVCLACATQTPERLRRSTVC
jgi:hypothetical protein